MKDAKIKVDVALNRLYITIGGKLSKQRLDELFTEVRFSVADLKPGFVLINNLSDCKIAALSGVLTFKRIMDYLALNGVGQVVRIVDKKSLVLRQLLNLTARMQRYKPIYVDSLEEAETTIKNIAHRDGLRFHLYQHSLEYMVNDVKGNGTILDISTSGCAVVSATIVPSIGDTVQTTFTFEDTDNLLSEFKIKARAIRAADDAFAVKFEDLESDGKEQLWKRLIYESQRDIS